MTRTKDWLKHSEELLEISNLLIDKQKYFWSCLTSQQAAAAALKAIISHIDESTFGDNLIALLRTIQNNSSVPDDTIVSISVEPVPPTLAAVAPPEPTKSLPLCVPKTSIVGSM